MVKNNCPICGNKEIEVVSREEGAYVGCDFCEFYTPTIHPIEEELVKCELTELERIEKIAIEVWNGITCSVKVPEYASKDK